MKELPLQQMLRWQYQQWHLYWDWTLYDAVVLKRKHGNMWVLSSVVATTAGYQAGNTFVVVTFDKEHHIWWILPQQCYPHPLRSQTIHLRSQTILFCRPRYIVFDPRDPKLFFIYREPRKPLDVVLLSSLLIFTCMYIYIYWPLAQGIQQGSNKRVNLIN